MVLKTELGIEPFFKKISIQPRFLTGFLVFDWFLPDFGGFYQTGLAPDSRLNCSNQPIRSGF